MTGSALLETRKLGLYAGNRWLLRDLDAGFEPGQNWAILGANGSGKSTFLHALAGLRKPDSGHVDLEGRDLHDWPGRERARRIGILFQDPPATFGASVLETVLTGRHPHLGRWQPEGPDDLDLAHQALDTVGLTPLAQRTTDTLSGGERRRMEVATLLVQQTPICLLDEPVNHLDPHYQITLLDLLSRRAATRHTLNILVLHDVNLAMRFCSHGLLLLPAGEVRLGPLDDIIDIPVLRKLYGCAMHEIRDADNRLYMPD